MDTRLHRSPSRPGLPRLAAPIRRRVGEPEWLLLLVLLANTAVVLALRHIPYQDTVNHLARYALLEQAFTGTAPAWIQAMPVPTPYVGIDMVGVVLMHFAGPHVAARVLAVIALAAMPVGLYMLLRALDVARSQRAWALVGALVSFSWFFTNGMLNYQIGIGALLVWLAAWWPRRTACTARARVGLAAGAALLFLVHLSAACIALLVLGLDVALVLGTDGRRLGVLSAARLYRARLVAALVSLMVIGVLWAAMTAASRTNPAETGGHVVIRSLRSKVWALTSPLYAFTPWEMLLTAVGLAMAVGAFVRVNRPVLGPNVFSATSAALLALYALTPLSAGGPSHLDVRWLLPLYMILFACAPASGAGVPPVIARILGITCLMHAAVVLQFGRRIDRELADFDTVLRQVPAHGRVLPLVAGTRAYAHTDPYMHYALWHVVTTGGRVGGLFSLNTRSIDGGTHVLPQFAHFREVDPPYAMDQRWTEVAPPLPWVEIHNEYDYIVSAGDDARLGVLVAAHACRLFAAGHVTLYTLAAPCGGMAERDH